MRRDWFYRHAGRVHGPVTIRDLRAAVLLRFVKPDDLVRERVLGDWTPAREVPELHEVARPQPGDEAGANCSGCTLVELLVVITIVAVLLAVLCEGIRRTDLTGPACGIQRHPEPPSLSPEKLQRRLAAPGGRTIAEILADLASRS